MKKIIVLLAVIAVSVLLYSPAQAIVNVEGRYWFTTLDSKVKVTDANVIGTEIDLVDTLGVDETRNFWEARLDLNLLDHHLRYGYMPMSWKGQKNITQTINFNGKNYAVGVQVDTDIDILYQRLGYEYDIINLLGNKFGIIFDVKYLSIDASVKAPAIDESHSVNAPIPTIGLAAQVGLPFLFSVGAEATGIAYGGNHVLDGEAFVSFNPVPFTTISGGYRIFDINVKDSDNQFAFKLKGPFLMVRIGW